MPHDGEQPPQMRRRARPDTETSQKPLHFPVSRTRKQSKTSPQTDAVYTADDIDISYPSRSNSSVVRYTNHQGIQTRRTGNQSSSSSLTGPYRQSGVKSSPSQRKLCSTTPQLHDKSRRNTHWLFYVGVGMIGALVLWLLGSSVVSWGQRVYNDLHYGYPRTFQTDDIVGHNQDSPAHPSHFVAMNLNRQAIIVEFMAGDPGKSVSYVAPIYIAGDGGDLAPVTLEFRDVNGDGKPDMIVHILLPSQSQVSVFINDGTRFRPSNGNDKLKI